MRQLFDDNAFDPDFSVEQNRDRDPTVIVGYSHEWSPEQRTLVLGGILQDRLDIRNRDSQVLNKVSEPISVLDS